MSVPLAFVAVIVIWTTTPLAIQWSSEGVGFAFGALSRMVIGAVMAFTLVLLLRINMGWTRKAWRTYAISAGNIFLGMSFVYWASQYIPSGWVSVIFGLNPLITGVFASPLLSEKVFTPLRVMGMGLALMGLSLIFLQGADMHVDTVWGVVAMLASVTFHSLGGVLMKRYGEPLPALTITAFGLLLSLPGFAALWWLSGVGMPSDISWRTLSAIVYLGVVGSTFGFMAYFYLLKHLAASQVSLIPLITPVSALMLGYALNNEPLTLTVVLGAGMILMGLAFYEWRSGLRGWFQRFYRE